MSVAAVLACLVIGIADGDTLTARCDTDAGPTNIIVRLAEIDAPEKRQAYGTRSQQHLAGLCFKKPAEITPQTIDRYGRTVARVVCEGSDANAEQVRAGMAWAYTQYTTDTRITRLERQARERHLGLWADSSPVAPWAWRRQSTSRHSTSAQCDGPPPWAKICFDNGE